MNTAGIDIGGTYIKAVLLNENKEIIGRDKISTPKNDADSTAKAIAELAKTVCKDSATPIGIACAGDVSNDGIISADNLGWNSVDFAGLLRKYTSRSFKLSQDARAAMEAERACGAMRGAKNAVYLCIGTGVGSDVVIGGHSLRELRPSCCEIGHMITHPDGLLCPCGNRGCFEQYASSSALSRMSEGRYTAKEIKDKAMIGDSECLKIWNKYITELGIGIMNCLIIYAPECICIGGGISEAGVFLTDSIVKELQKYPYYTGYFTSTRIVTAHFASDAGAMGAAILADSANSFNA